MKRTSLLLVLAAAFASVPLGAAGVETGAYTAAREPAQNGIRPVSLEEIKTLSSKGVSSDIIIKLLQNHPAIYNLNANDVVDLKAAEVKPEVIDYLLSTPRHAQSPATSSAPAETTATTSSAATAPLVPQMATTDADYAYPAGYPGYSYPYYGYSYPYNYYPYNYYYPPSYYYGFGFGVPFTFFFDGHSHDHNHHGHSSDFHGGTVHSGGFHGGTVHSSGFHGGTVHSGGFHGGSVHSSGFHGGGGSHGGGGGHGGGHH